MSSSLRVYLSTRNKPQLGPVTDPFGLSIGDRCIPMAAEPCIVVRTGSSKYVLKKNTAANSFGRGSACNHASGQVRVREVAKLMGLGRLFWVGSSAAAEGAHLRPIVESYASGAAHHYATRVESPCPLEGSSDDFVSQPTAVRLTGDHDHGAKVDRPKAAMDITYVPKARLHLRLDRRPGGSTSRSAWTTGARPATTCSSSVF
jgi:hypothetical protein